MYENMGLTRPLTKKAKEEIGANPYYRICARRNNECSGRITIEHAIMYAGRRIDDIWALLPLCWYHHLGAGLNKRINEKIAIRRASQKDLEKYPKRKWR